LLAGVSLLVSLPVVAVAEEARGETFIRALDRMMVQLGPQSARASKAIRDAYRAHLDLLVLDAYADLEVALRNGGLAPLPHDPLRFNVTPRLDGPSPIGEKDLTRQVSYIAARPATIGALLDIASRVKSGPVEITSLVRHTEYQGALGSTNPNARTAVPMHTMGLAFDIALVNTPLETVQDIRAVLLEMRDAGEILFIGERRQLVFHVVPHPSRLGHFHQVYAQALGYQPKTDLAQVVALSRGGRGEASVSADVIAILPAGDHADEWWAIEHAETDLLVAVMPEAVEPVTTSPAIAAADRLPPTTAGWIVLLAAGIVAGTWTRMIGGSIDPSIGRWRLVDGDQPIAR
jgi:hypothetical protein